MVLRGPDGTWGAARLSRPPAAASPSFSDHLQGSTSNVFSAGSESIHAETYSVDG